MDPWILLRLPVFTTLWMVGKIGWKGVLIGWALAIVFVIYLNYHF